MKEFTAEYKIINGKKTLVVNCWTEEICNGDGSKSVIVHAPTLEIIQKFKKEHAEKNNEPVNCTVYPQALSISGKSN